MDKFITKSPLFLALVPTHPIVNFTVERMKERLAVKAQGVEDKRRDFLTRCFEAQSKYPDLVTDKILAGSDTTGISFRSVSTALPTMVLSPVGLLTVSEVFYYLMKSPDCLKKVVEEIDQADKAGNLSEFVTWKESNNLPYLQACIKEALSRVMSCTSCTFPSAKYAPF